MQTHLQRIIYKLERLITSSITVARFPALLFLPPNDLYLDSHERKQATVCQISYNNQVTSGDMANWLIGEHRRDISNKWAYS